MKEKRFLICLIGGIITATICITGGILREAITGFSFGLIASVLNRILIGFTIGISNLKSLHYILHGAIIGGILSLTISFTFLPGDILSFILYTFAGIIYGILIELFSTRIFKHGIKAD